MLDAYDKKFIVDTVKKHKGVCNMSHLAHIDLELKDLQALKDMCKEHGFTFMEGQKSYKWFGKWMNDYDAADSAYKHGFKTEDYGKCSHAIKVPGASYEIGIVEIRKGVYKPIWDFFSSGGLKPTHIQKLKQGYVDHVITRNCKKNGYRIKNKKKEKDGKLRLVLEKI